MSIKTAVIKAASTGITPAGGSDASLVSVSDDSSKHHVYIGTGNFLERINIEFSKTEPTKSATSPDGYTQSRRTLVLKEPRTLANELTTVDTVRLTLSTSVETTVAQKREIRRKVAQLLADSDFDPFWDNGSLS